MRALILALCSFMIGATCSAITFNRQLERVEARMTEVLAADNDLKRSDAAIKEANDHLQEATYSFMHSMHLLREHCRLK